MKSLPIFLLFIISFLCLNSSYSQSDNGGATDLKGGQITNEVEATIIPRIELKAKITEEGIFFRWAPNTALIWQDGIADGYILEKGKVVIQGQDTSFQFTPITPTPIKPWPLQQWKSIVNDDKPFAAAAAMCIYGNNEEQGFINQANDEQTKFGFNLLSADLDRDAALASGLAYFDKDFKPDEFPLYRIKLANATLSNFSSYRDLNIFDFKRTKPYTPSIAETSAQETSISLFWEKLDMGERPTAFHIERSTDGTNFQRINKQPYIDVTTNLTKGSERVVYLDDSLNMNTTYYYRLIAIDAFSDLSDPSEIVEAKTEDKTPPNPAYEVTTQEGEEGEVLINWAWKDYEQHNDLAGFKVLRSHKIDGLYELMHQDLLPNNTLRFIDKNPDPRKTNFYKVITVDNNGNESRSNIAFNIIQDNIAPQTPSNLSAEIDTTGHLLVQWEAPTDEDIRGYLLHYSNREEGPFAVVPGGHLPFTHFVDSITLKTLTEEMYFYVVAVDYSYNPSKRSEIIKVQKPDMVPPQASFFGKYTVSEEGIYFEWIKSKSLDVVDISLMRKTVDSEWQKVEDFDASQKSYLDKNVMGGKYYEYSLITTDDAGNETFPKKNLGLEALTPFFIADVENFNIEKNNGQVVLSWEFQDVSTHEFILYKKTNDGKLKTLKRIAGQNNYADVSVSKKNNYSYAIKAKAKDGRESKLSPILDIQL